MKPAGPLQPPPPPLCAITFPSPGPIPPKTPVEDHHVRVDRDAVPRLPRFTVSAGFVPTKLPWKTENLPPKPWPTLPPITLPSLAPVPPIWTPFGEVQMIPVAVRDRVATMVLSVPMRLPFTAPGDVVLDVDAAQPGISGDEVAVRRIGAADRHVDRRLVAESAESEKPRRSATRRR